jgi:hypothetical protein
METAGLLGNCEVWITNEHEHQAYRVTPGRVAERLFAMLDQRRAQSRPPDARRPQGDVRP